MTLIFLIFILINQPYDLRKFAQTLFGQNREVFQANSLLE